MQFKRRLPIPQEIKEQYPVTAEDAKIREQQIERIQSVLSGSSDRFLIVIGPCSADNPDAVFAYMEELARLSQQVRDKIEIIPRVYTNKPRSTGSGYKGILHQPDPENSPDLLGGIVATRLLHQRVLHDYGFGCADEMLYPEGHRFLSDLLAYVAIGARSVEDQQHRLTASGLDIPVGMKNPSGGSLHVLANSVYAAQQGHTFIYRNWEVETSGNPYTHAILRGYSDLNDRMVPNYDSDSIKKLTVLFEKSEIRFPSILIDTNHANSNKCCFAQIDIAKSVVSMRNDAEIRPYLKGLMIESYLEDGAQEVGGGVFGKSITDPCIGWEKTERLILDLADTLS